MAITERQPKRGTLIHHSNRGVQYACSEYAFSSMAQTALAAKALDSKTKELITLPISVAARCDCMGQRPESQSGATTC